MRDPNLHKNHSTINYLRGGFGRQPRLGTQPRNVLDVANSKVNARWNEELSAATGHNA
jgi:hypothetical protein